MSEGVFFVVSLLALWKLIEILFWIVNGGEIGLR